MNQGYNSLAFYMNFYFENRTSHDSTLTLHTELRYMILL